MLANHRQAREKVSNGSQKGRRYSAKGSQHSKTSSYKDRAKQYYTSFGGKHDYHDDPHQETGHSKTPQQK